MGPRTIPGPSRIRPALAVALALVTAAMPGCGMVPRTRLADCAKLSQSLQADNSQLKDQVVKLRAENQEFAQRAVDDSGQIRRLSAENNRMERSIAAYQDDRERLNTAFQDVKEKVHQAALLDDAGMGRK
ncbi:hypothetical protein EP7_002695 [Isosphaeraceae bacterium EP7]